MNQKDILVNWLKACILLTLLQYGLFEYHNNDYLNLIDDVLIVGLFIILAIMSMSTRQNYSSIKGSTYDIPIIIFLAIALISTSLNMVPLPNFLLGIKGYFLYFLFFYCIIWLRLDNKDIQSIMRFTLKIFVLQLAVASLQLALGLADGTLNPDSLTGTFNGANYLGYAAFAMLFFALHMYYINSNASFIGYTAVLAIILLITSARFAILLFPLVFFMLNPKDSIKRLTPTKVITIIAAIMIVLAVLTPSFIGGGEDITEYYRPSVLIAHFTEAEYNIYSGSARNLWFPLTQEHLKDYAYSPLIGFGPGMYASHAAYKLMPSTNDLIYNYYGQLEIGLDADIDSQIIPIWGELGYLGIITTYGLLVLILVRMIMLRRRSDNKYFQALASATAGYTIFFMLGFYVNHMLESQTTAILFFLLLGVTEKYYRNLKKKEENVT